MVSLLSIFITPFLLLFARISKLYETILEYNTIPDNISTDVIVPILKKPTACQSDPNNYRPITLSTIHSKMLEMILFPYSDISCSQYGYQKNKGVDFCHSFINDAIKCYSASNSPVYICSLDADKCFDSIWHHGLFFKLKDKICDVT